MKSFQEALDWLYGVQIFGVKLGLDSMERLVAEMGLGIVTGVSQVSRTDATDTPKIIHVAGTNGKGSTCAMIASICRQAGLRTGLYTSPHLVCFRERIQVNGELISEAGALDGLRRIRCLVEDWNPHPTFFEIVTALALDWFQQKGVQVLVLETGLGGRLDATNIVVPTVAVLTSIGMDHVQVLGGSLRGIATEKAGIIKPQIPVVSAPQDPEVLEVIQSVCAKMGSVLSVVSNPVSECAVGLPGEIQRWNAAVAQSAVDAAELAVSLEAQRAGLAKVIWPGRFQKLGERLILDGAHNEAAARVLVSTWLELYPGEKATVLFGALADKDVVAVLRTLSPIIGELIVVPVFSPRALDPGDLLRMSQDLLPGVPCRACVSLSDALNEPTERRRLATGSLYLIGEILASQDGMKPEWSSQ